MSRRISGSSFSARVEDVAALAAGAGDDQHVDALGDVRAPSWPRPCSTRRRGARARPSAAAVHSRLLPVLTSVSTRSSGAGQWSGSTDGIPIPRSCHRAGGRPDGHGLPPCHVPARLPDDRQVAGSSASSACLAGAALAIWWGLAGTVGAGRPGPTSGSRARRRPQRRRSTYDVAPAGRPRRVVHRAGAGQPARSGRGGDRRGSRPASRRRCTSVTTVQTADPGRDRRGRGLQRPALSPPPGRSAERADAAHSERSLAPAYPRLLVASSLPPVASGPRDLRRSGSGPASWHLASPHDERRRPHVTARRDRDRDQRHPSPG